MRISKLFRLSWRTGSDRKLLPAMLAFGAGQKADRRPARGSIRPLGRMLVGTPKLSTAIGTPQSPFGFRGDGFAVVPPAMRALKSSPTYVGLPLQSSAGWLVGLPCESTAMTGLVRSKNDEKFPATIVGVGTMLRCGTAWLMRSP